MVEDKERVISSGILEQMTMEELLDIYNESLPRTKRKSFSSVAEAVRMILERLLEVSRRKPSRKPKPRRGRPYELLDLPPCVGRGKLTTKTGKARRGTKRELLLRMLGRKNGTTLLQVEAALGCSRKLARGSLLQINLDLGYGIREQEDGRLILEKPLQDKESE